MRTVAPARPATPRPDPEEAADELVALAQATTFGRVDDDGTVWVRTADGERSVGSYPGASPEDALIYFARKYTDLVAQVDLLEQRIRSTDLAAKDAVPAIDRMRETVAEAAVVGDLAALDSRLDALAAVADKRRAKAEAARQRAREAARATKERIVTEAESLAASTQWKATGDRLRELLEEWKVAPRLERKADDELWKRFSAARTAFDKARRQHFATLDSGREDARQRKEKLVKEAESLSGSKDWGPTSARFRDLMTEWKAAGRAGREHEDALWERFRTAQDAFFSARSGVFAERDADQKANLERKEALVVEAEALLPISNLGAAKRAMRSISERWDAIGHVPRGDRDRVEGRLRRVEETIRGAEEGEWRRTNPEARARAEATVAQLRTSIEKLEAQAAKDRAAGKESAAAKSDEAVAVRRTWLAEAERTLADLTR